MSVLGYAFSRYKDAESLDTAFRYYDKSCDLDPNSEFKAKNRDITVRQLRVAFEGLGKAGDKDLLTRYYDQYRDLAERHPEKSAYVSLRDRAEKDLSFVLSNQEDMESKELACRYFEDLAQRFPEETVHAKNLRITRGQIAFIYYKRGTDGKDPEALKKSYEMYRELADKYPEIENYRKNRDIIKKNLGLG